MNTITITGRLGADPQIRRTKTGKAVCTISLAINERIKRGAGYEEIVTWHRIVLWQSLAEEAQKTLKKGSAVRIEGFRKSRTFEGRDGVMREIVELIADKCTALDSLPKSAPANGSKPKGGGVPRAQIPESEIPF